MKIISKIGNDDIAIVYIAENSNGQKIEFVESIQPPLYREEKWVLMISTLYGCPVKCKFCDAGGCYGGKVSFDDMIFQVHNLIQSRYPDFNVPVEKFKVQFSRMGEPALNMAVLDVIKEIPNRYNLKSYMPSVSTIAPVGCEEFFERLLSVFHSFKEGTFQMQFSLHATDYKYRDWLIPVKKWNFKEISNYGEKLYRNGDRKITLNFAISKDTIINENVLLDNFDPAKFLVKITPINPTYKAIENSIESLVESSNKTPEVLDRLKNTGYDVILSVGELEENLIGSNCGQYILHNSKEHSKIDNSYTYQMRTL